MPVLGARAAAHRSRGPPVLLRADLWAQRSALAAWAPTRGSAGAPSVARPASPIARPLVLQASGADGAPCVRYAGGTAPLAALQELAESWETKPGWTLDEQEFAAFLGGPSVF